MPSSWLLPRLDTASVVIIMLYVLPHVALFSYYKRLRVNTHVGPPVGYFMYKLWTHPLHKSTMTSNRVLIKSSYAHRDLPIKLHTYLIPTCHYLGMCTMIPGSV